MTVPVNLLPSKEIILAEVIVESVIFAPLSLVNPAPLPKKSPPKNLFAVTPLVAMKF